MIRVFLVCSVLLNLLDLFPQFSWVQEKLILFSQYYLWLLPIGLVFVWLGAIRHKKLLSLVIVLVLIHQLWPIVSLLFEADSGQSAQPKYKILYSRSLQDLEQLIKSKNPDVLILFADLQDKLTSLPVLPYKVQAENISLFSKLPFDEEPYTDWGDAVPPAISAVLFPERVRIVALKTIPYDSTEALASNRVLLRRISTELRHKEDNLVMVGDLGVTLWSPFYKRFSSGTRAINVLGYFGVHKLLEALFKVQTEHVLVKGNIIPIALEIINDGSYFLQIEVGQ